MRRVHGIHLVRQGPVRVIVWRIGWCLVEVTSNNHFETHPSSIAGPYQRPAEPEYFAPEIRQRT
jgi:hypothetical protein